jgi:hypothetical protein
LMLTPLPRSVPLFVLHLAKCLPRILLCFW